MIAAIRPKPLIFQDEAPVNRVFTLPSRPAALARRNISFQCRSVLFQFPRFADGGERGERAPGHWHVIGFDRRTNPGPPLDGRNGPPHGL